jgi:Fe2+ or Zn2+ uptake regulation protein
MPQTIVFEANGERHEAVVSAMRWDRLAVGDDHVTVEHSSQSYVIAIVQGANGNFFAAFPIDEASLIPVEEPSHSYLVCRSCGHVETIPAHHDLPLVCENCRSGSVEQRDDLSEDWTEQ